jgi:hypothetical protein
MKKNIGYCAHINGLQALAVIFIVLFHVFPNWGNGSLIGVDIFFVISSLILIFEGVTQDHSVSPMNIVILTLPKFKKLFKNMICSYPLFNQKIPSLLFVVGVSCFVESDKYSFIDDGKPLLRDAYGHISEYGSIKLSTLFEDWDQKNVPGLLA